MMDEHTSVRSEFSFPTQQSNALEITPDKGMLAVAGKKLLLIFYPHK